MNLTTFIKFISILAFKNAYPELPLVDLGIDLQKDIEITEATKPEFGHYQFNGAMKLTKKLGVPPRKIAENICDHLLTSNSNISESTIFESTISDKTDRQIFDEYLENFQWPIQFFSKIEIAGPGFINFTLHPGFLSQIINQQIVDPKLGVGLPQLFLNELPLQLPKLNRPLKIIIDYSSPNVAKEMHVGHLRTTIIGDCLARLFRFLEQEVLALNHIGDWGTQFGMLIAYLKDKLPAITNETPPDVKLKDLVQWYRAAKTRFDEDPEFKKRSQQEVVQLQAGASESLHIWKTICAISREAYQVIYDLLDIKDLNERGESFYNPLLPDLIADLEQKGLITVSDGAKCMFLEGFINRNGDPLPLILQKADGAYNYATTDLASIRHRIKEEKADWIIYVIDAGQSQHLQMVFAAAKEAGYYDPKQTRLDHVDFGLVLRPDGKKFKTREGETERLVDLLEGAIQKARVSLQEKNPEIEAEELVKSATILGIDAVKYADLSCHRTSDYMFSYDKMLSFEGNTAAFLLYAYVRIQGIERKAQVNIKDLLEKGLQIVLEEPAEIQLGLLVCQFPQVLAQTVQELLPNRLTDYLFRLAEKFHVFFHQCRVEGSKQQNSRLLLCYAVARVLEKGLQILGLETLKRM